MTNKQKSFLFSATILMGITVAISQLIFSTVFVTFFFPLRITSICFVWVATCLFHYWVMKTVMDKPNAFARVFMMQTTIKLLLYMAYVAGYLYVFKQHGVPFTVHFLIVYFCFAIFEVAALSRFVKNSGRVSESV